MKLHGMSAFLVWPLSLSIIILSFFRAVARIRNALLTLSSLLLDGHTTVCLSIYLLVDIRVVVIFCFCL